MRFTTPVFEAASTDQARPVLAGVWFDAKAKTLAATNSYIAAVVSCEVEDGDVSGLIPAAALKEAWKQGRGSGTLAVSKEAATLRLPDGDRSWKLLTGEFPNIEQIAARAIEVPDPFGVNPALLRQVGSALGASEKSNVALEVHAAHPLRPIRVTTRGGWGVVMPVRLARHPGQAPDFRDEAVVLAGIEAAATALRQRRGRRRALEAFHDAALAVTEEIAQAADEAAKQKAALAAGKEGK